MKEWAGKLTRIPEKLAIMRLRSQIHPATWENNQRLDDLLGQCASMEGDPIAQHAQRLRQACLDQFQGCYEGEKPPKILIQMPGLVALGVVSIFTNWIQTLKYMGVEVEALPWEERGAERYARFQPDLVILYDVPSYLENFDWKSFDQYRQERPCRLAMVVFHEHDLKIPNQLRIENALKNKVDLFLTFRVPAYVDQWLQEWQATGKPVLSIPFGANPLAYYPQPMKAKLDFVFLGSSNPEKALRYAEYLPHIFKNYQGSLVGPGWGSNAPKFLPLEQHPAFYGLAEIAPNLHLQIQIELEYELNERVYNLAASGCFQLLDHPKALGYLFPQADQVVSTSTSREYHEAFAHYLHHPEERTSFQMKGLDAVYQGHTLFHRMQSLIDHLLTQSAS